MLARMWNHWNPHSLLVRGTVTLENSVAVPPKVKHSHHLTSKATPKYVPKTNERTHPYNSLYMNIHSNIIHKSQKVETAQMSMN